MGYECIHCGEYEPEHVKDHWERCVKHPAHQRLAELEEIVQAAISFKNAPSYNDWVEYQKLYSLIMNYEKNKRIEANE